MQDRTEETWFNRGYWDGRADGANPRADLELKVDSVARDIDNGWCAPGLDRDEYLAGYREGFQEARAQA